MDLSSAILVLVCRGPNLLLSESVNVVYTLSQTCGGWKVDTKFEREIKEGRAVEVKILWKFQPFTVTLGCV